MLFPKEFLPQDCDSSLHSPYNWLENEEDMHPDDIEYFIELVEDRMDDEGFYRVGPHLWTSIKRSAWISNRPLTREEHSPQGSELLISDGNCKVITDVNADDEPLFNTRVAHDKRLFYDAIKSVGHIIPEVPSELSAEEQEITTLRDLVQSFFNVSGITAITVFRDRLVLWKGCAIKIFKDQFLPFLYHVSPYMMFEVQIPEVYYSVEYIMSGQGVNLKQVSTIAKRACLFPGAGTRDLRKMGADLLIQYVTDTYKHLMHDERKWGRMLASMLATHNIILNAENLIWYNEIRKIPLPKHDVVDWFLVFLGVIVGNSNYLAGNKFLRAMEFDLRAPFLPIINEFASTVVDISWDDNGAVLRVADYDLDISIGNCDYNMDIDRLQDFPSVLGIGDAGALRIDSVGPYINLIFTYSKMEDSQDKERYKQMFQDAMGKDLGDKLVSQCDRIEKYLNSWSYEDSSHVSSHTDSDDLPLLEDNELDLADQILIYRNDTVYTSSAFDPYDSYAPDQEYAYGDDVVYSPSEYRTVPSAYQDYHVYELPLHPKTVKVELDYLESYDQKHTPDPFRAWDAFVSKGIITNAKLVTKSFSDRGLPVSWDIRLYVHIRGVPYRFCMSVPSESCLAVIMLIREVVFFVKYSETSSTVSTSSSYG